jgi:hypothetical protein
LSEAVRSLTRASLALYPSAPTRCGCGQMRKAWKVSELFSVPNPVLAMYSVASSKIPVSGKQFNIIYQFSPAAMVPDGTRPTTTAANNDTRNFFYNVAHSNPAVTHLVFMLRDTVDLAANQAQRVAAVQHWEKMRDAPVQKSATQLAASTMKLTRCVRSAPRSSEHGPQWICSHRALAPVSFVSLPTPTCSFAMKHPQSRVCKWRT